MQEPQRDKEKIMRVSRFRIVGLTMLMAALLFGCKKEKEQAETIFAVNAIKAVKGEIHDYIEINGDVKATTEVDVYPDNMGKLVGIYVRIGDRVQTGQILAEIDPSKPGMTFSLSPVRSTLTGTVTEIPAQLGATVSPQTPVVKVGIITDIKIISYISERFISKMKQGLNVFLKVEAYPEKMFNAKISDVSPIVDPSTRMLEIRSRLNQPDNLLKPGMFARLKIITEKKDGVVKIPADAVVNRFGSNYVFVVKERKLTEDENKKIAEKKASQKKNKPKKGSEVVEEEKPVSDIVTFVERREVTLGIRIDDKVEIVSGLNPDELVVIRGQTLLEDNTKVNLISTLPSLSIEDKIN